MKEVKIYKYTSPSGKSYIGQTKRELIIRSGGNSGIHYKKCTVFYRAIQKYGGLNNFKSEILLICGQNEADYYEKLMISSWNTLTPNGYNINKGGDSSVSDTWKKVAKEIREKKGIIDGETKICCLKKCEHGGKIQPITNFSIENKKNPTHTYDKYASTCKDCVKKYCKGRYSRKRKLILQKCAEYQRSKVGRLRNQIANCKYKLRKRQRNGKRNNNQRILTIKKKEEELNEFLENERMSIEDFSA